MECVIPHGAIVDQYACIKMECVILQGAIVDQYACIKMQCVIPQGAVPGDKILQCSWCYCGCPRANNTDTYMLYRSFILN